MDKSILLKLPRTCPFFRYQPGSGRACCTVYQTRPDICRDYGCWRLLILNHRGRIAGKIKNIRSLWSEDPHLTRVWEICIENNQEQDDRIWENEMIHILNRAGYTIRR